ncbi:FAD/NAD(P)-binding protein [Streptomyces yaizuensis]|uniref:FAD/NAD(P)-binding protein n=1 Tax=Streptomyces yaizuensis TaxID=2989713 RepID=A0ABQ5P7B2_9ACTN|nr:FAD/NAD(P)-binding protein [Streptomyces sp. YSPA8]
MGNNMAGGIPDASGAHRVAVVGSGPRGLSVVERLAARLAAEPRDGLRPVEIFLIDPVEVGCGRIWRSDQPEWFMMNTVADEISAFSGIPDDGPHRAGAGPSFGEWWRATDPDHPGPNSYAPRAVYGRYMRYVLSAARDGLPAGVRLHEVRLSVEDLVPTGGGYRLRLSDGSRLFADRVVLTTGHARPGPSGEQRELAEFAAAHPRLRHLRGDSAADMPLCDVPAGSAVGVLGLGLAFYDVMAAFTIGRGGSFKEGGDGRLVYVPSGREPVLVAGSRSGMPLPARGRNQKSATNPYRPVLFTAERVRHGRAAGPVDFRADVMPWLRAEMSLVYYAAHIRHRSGARAAEAFTAELALPVGAPLPDVAAVAGRHGAGDLPPLDLDRLARPFAGRSYPDHAAFESELLAVIRRDLEEAAKGNVGSPLKAALDVLRDTRWVIRAFVDYGGLDPRSHRDDFLGWYVPRSAFLAAGPPPVRLEQTAALIASGVLRIVGPGTRFVPDPASGRFVAHSPQIAGSRVTVDTVLDARIPTPDVRRDPSPLTRRLRERGIWTSYVNGFGEEAFDTGGVAVTASPYHPIGSDGTADTGLYVLGIPTEHTRWFMQAGSSRPGIWSDFVYDADAIAGDALIRRTGPDAEPGAVPGAEPEGERPAPRRPGSPCALGI